MLLAQADARLSPVQRAIITQAAQTLCSKLAEVEGQRSKLLQPAFAVSGPRPLSEPADACAHLMGLRRRAESI